ncbi:MAG: hypothetical protein ICV59_09345 [Thermoleophilia bacterium]|nr:hypothetical protein [Thermoleophilia bacterium]
MLADGLFSPTVDDVFRLVIVVIGTITILVVLLGLVVLRRYARLLLDVEQATREARNRLREQTDTQLRNVARDMGTLSADVGELRKMQEQAEARRRHEVAG